MKKDFEELQYHEQKDTNIILWINTIATVIIGIANVVIAIILLYK